MPDLASASSARTVLADWWSEGVCGWPAEAALGEPLPQSLGWDGDEEGEELFDDEDVDLDDDDEAIEEEEFFDDDEEEFDEEGDLEEGLDDDEL
jgi:hypothetical protein